MTASPPHFTVLDAPLTAFDMGDGISGHQAILYKSSNGTRLAGSFKESGRHDFHLPFDEFIYVVTGSSTISVEGAEPFTLNAGDCCYLEAGKDVVFENSDDFQDVVVLISDADAIDVGDASP